MKIIITKEGNSWIVTTDEDKTSEELGYDEAIGTVASLIMQEELMKNNSLKCLQWMKFKEHHYFLRLANEDKYKTLLNTYITRFITQNQVLTKFVVMNNNIQYRLICYNNALMLENKSGYKFHIDLLNEKDIQTLINMKER